MPLVPRIKPYNQRPSGNGITPDQAAFYDWIQTSINSLIGQLPATSQGVTATNPSTVDPSSSQLTSVGARPGSLATAITFVATPTSIGFHWDGTNGSKPLVVYRDDGTTLPALAGSLIVGGLSPSTLYYFYPFYQESVIPVNNFGSQVPGINFGFASGVGVGTPAVAFTSPNIVAAQLQIARDHIPLGSLLSTQGISTPPTGTSSGTCGGGGGGVGAYLASTFS